MLKFRKATAFVRHPHNCCAPLHARTIVHLLAEGVEVDEAGDGEDAGEHVGQRHREEQQVGRAAHVALHEHDAHERVGDDGEGDERRRDEAVHRDRQAATQGTLTSAAQVHTRRRQQRSCSRPVAPLRLIDHNTSAFFAGRQLSDSHLPSLLLPVLSPKRNAGAKLKKYTKLILCSE